MFDEHSEPRCGNVPLTRTPNTTRGIRLGEYCSPDTVVLSFFRSF